MTTQHKSMPTAMPAHAARLRPADIRAPRDGQAAGPFEAADERKGSTMRDALMTGLLVIYPGLGHGGGDRRRAVPAGAGGVRPPSPSPRGEGGSRGRS